MIGGHYCTALLPNLVGPRRVRGPLQIQCRDPAYCDILRSGDGVGPLERVLDHIPVRESDVRCSTVYVLSAVAEATLPAISSH